MTALGSPEVKLKESQALGRNRFNGRGGHPKKLDS
jgi:hypothetical protein